MKTFHYCRYFSLLISFFLVQLVCAQNSGHRLGGDIFKPENTLYCLEKFLQKYSEKPSFKYLELDIQESKEGEIIVFHDVQSIKRIVPKSETNLKILHRVLQNKKFKTIRIRDLTKDEITALQLKNNASIPTLEDVLIACKKKKVTKPVLVEIKSLFSDQCRMKLIKLMAQYQKTLELHFLAFPINFANAFPDPLRWGPMIKANKFKVFTAGKAKVSAFDLVKDFDPIEITRRKFITLLEQTDFSIVEPTKRSFSFPIIIPKEISGNLNLVLRIGIFHGYDNSGDRGLVYKILDGSQKKRAEGFTKSKEWKWFEIEVKEKEEFNLLIEDYDTKINGAYPGNGATVKVALVIHKS